MAPEVGLEPTTLRLTAECSAIELLRNLVPRPVASPHNFLSYNKPHCQGQRAGRAKAAYSVTMCASIVLPVRLTFAKVTGRSNRRGPTLPGFR
jgi:hypothetical protein